MHRLLIFYYQSQMRLCCGRICDVIYLCYSQILPAFANSPAQNFIFLILTNSCVLYNKALKGEIALNPQLAPSNNNNNNHHQLMSHFDQLLSIRVNLDKRLMSGVSLTTVHLLILCDCPDKSSCYIVCCLVTGLRPAISVPGLDST